MSETNGNGSASVCNSCHQPLPGASPYRGSIPQEQIDESPISILRNRVSSVWSSIKTSTPQPIQWMFKSLGWVVVGTAVVSATAIAGYFVVRYLIWYLIVMLGKWLLDRIGRGIPRVVDGMSVGLPHTDFGYWEIGMLGVVGVVVCALVGKVILHYAKNSNALQATS